MFLTQTYNCTCTWFCNYCLTSWVFPLCWGVDGRLGNRARPVEWNSWGTSVTVWTIHLQSDSEKPAVVVSPVETYYDTMIVLMQCWDDTGVVNSAVWSMFKQTDTWQSASWILSNTPALTWLHPGCMEPGVRLDSHSRALEPTESCFLCYVEEAHFPQQCLNVCCKTHQYDNRVSRLVERERVLSASRVIMQKRFVEF